MMLMGQHTVAVTDEAVTKKLAEKLSEALVPGLVIHLSGDLGAGKTTLCRYIIGALGYQGRVKSPTYTLVESYPLEIGMLYHFDLYRLADPSELEYMGYRDYFEQRAVCLVEWPEMAGGLLGKPDLEIQIKLDQGQRELDLLAFSEAGIFLAEQAAAI